MATARRLYSNFGNTLFSDKNPKKNPIALAMGFFIVERSFRDGVDSSGQMRFFTSRVVLVEHVVGCRLVNGLAGSLQEGLRLICIPCCHGVHDFTSRLLYTGLFCDVSRVTFRVGLDAQDRCFNIRQILHPLCHKITK